GSAIARGREDRRGIDVHAADDEQIVPAPDDALPEAGAPALARCALDPGDVAATEPHHRHGLARQRGVDHLADGARLDLDWFLRLRVDELDPYMSRTAEMHALLWLL